MRQCCWMKSMAAAPSPARISTEVTGDSHRGRLTIDQQISDSLGLRLTESAGPAGSFPHLLPQAEHLDGLGLPLAQLLQLVYSTSACQQSLTSSSTSNTGARSGAWPACSIASARFAATTAWPSVSLILLRLVGDMP